MYPHSKRVALFCTMKACGTAAATGRPSPHLKGHPWFRAFPCACEGAARVFSKLTNHLKERMSMLNYW